MSNKLSLRHIPDLPKNKTAAIEATPSGVGVSTTARKYLRQFYIKNNLLSMAVLKNDALNAVIAADFVKATPLHRFKLKSGEIAEIRKSGVDNSFYVAVIRSDLKSPRYDVIVIQPGFKLAPAELSKRRLSPDWEPKK